MTRFPGRIDWDEVIDRIEMERSGELEDAVEEARKQNVYHGSKVTRGIPQQEIVNRAENLDVDLIVMGEKGRTGVESMMGSTLRRVLENSERPVMSVKN